MGHRSVSHTFQSSRAYMCKCFTSHAHQLPSHTHYLFIFILFNRILSILFVINRQNENDNLSCDSIIIIVGFHFCWFIRNYLVATLLLERREYKSEKNVIKWNLFRKVIFILHKSNHLSGWQTSGIKLRMSDDGMPDKCCHFWYLLYDECELAF